MQIALRRSYATAGVALVGAGVIAVSPIAPPVPDLHLPSLRAPAVELTALPSWLQWVNEGTANIEHQITAVVSLIQDEIADPLPVLSQIVQNQIANGQRLADAFTTSGGIVAGTVAGLPAALLNAISDAIDDPSQIPVIVSGLVQNLVAQGALAAATVINAVTDVVTTTVTRAVGVASALVSNVAPITLAALTAPFAIGETVFNSGVAVLAAVATLNPLNVISALGEGAVAVEAEVFNQASNFVNALGDLRDDVLNALTVPLPPSAPSPVMAARGAAAETLPSESGQRFNLSVDANATDGGKDLDGTQAGGAEVDEVNGSGAADLVDGAGAAGLEGTGSEGEAGDTLTAATTEEKPKTEVKQKQDPYRPLKQAVARTERMAAQVLNSTLRIAGVTVNAQGRVASAAVTGAGKVASTAVSGGDVREAASAARDDVAAKADEGRAAAREATTQAGKDLAQASKGKVAQAKSDSDDSSAGASASDG